MTTVIQKPREVRESPPPPPTLNGDRWMTRFFFSNEGVPCHKEALWGLCACCARTMLQAYYIPFIRRVLLRVGGGGSVLLVAGVGAATRHPPHQALATGPAYAVEAHDRERH